MIENFLKEKHYICFCFNSKLNFANLTIFLIIKDSHILSCRLKVSYNNDFSSINLGDISRSVQKRVIEPKNDVYGWIFFDQTLLDFILNKNQKSDIFEAKLINATEFLEELKKFVVSTLESNNLL
jgi:hypothetical protein